jgi:protease-4
LRWLRRLLVGLLATIGALTLLLAVALAVGGWWLVQQLERARGLPESILLVADLREGLDDRLPDPLARLRLEPRLGLSEAVLALDRASRDPRVKGLVARLGDGAQGYATIQELRAAIGRFRAAGGRSTVAFADSFGELGPGNQPYLLATAFERIRLQPVGLVGLTGLMAEVPFAKALLDDLGVSLSIGKREQYKTAFDSLTETGLTPANREMLEELLASLAGQLAGGIAEGRGLAEGRVRAIIDGGPYDAAEAVELGLVDDLAYWDEVLAEAKAATDGETVPLAAYAAATEPEEGAGTPVALVRASGPIFRGEGQFGGIAADSLAEALGDAVEDVEVAAILLRLDSPGGSAVASETVARQIRRSVAAGKPVIVSMGNTAASGGYWIAKDATTILAQPATLTGSIGVIGGKPVLAGLWEELKISWARLPTAANADMWSNQSDYSPAGRARLEGLLDAIYQSFKAGVAEGRKLPPETVERIAKGRVWSGREAVELGLVDELGGLLEAQAAVRMAVGLDPAAALDLRPFPKPRSPFAEALELLRGEVGGLLGFMRGTAALLGPGVARMPPLQLR